MGANMGAISMPALNAAKVQSHALNAAVCERIGNPILTKDKEYERKYSNTSNSEENNQ